MFDAYHNVLPNDLQQLFVKSIPSYSAHRTHQFMRENVRSNMRIMSIPFNITSKIYLNVITLIYS